MNSKKILLIMAVAAVTTTAAIVTIKLIRKQRMNKKLTERGQQIGQEIYK